MHTCFINPPAPYLKDPGAQVPLGILYLAAILEKYNYSVEIQDLSFYIKDEDILNVLSEADVYGITCTSMQLLGACRLAKLIKTVYPKSKVILGGPGTITPEYVDWYYVDSIVIGEAENDILGILQDIKIGNLKSVYYGTQVSDLDSLPLPARHLVTHKGGNIFAYGKQYAEGQSTQIITSRGCPYKCSFCAAPMLCKGMRFRGFKSIEAEVRDVTENLGIHQIRLADDTFFAKRKRCFNIIEILAKYEALFRISTRVKPLDIALWDFARQGGLREFSFGIESFDDLVLNGLQKRTTAFDNMEALRLAADCGIPARILMMIRTPFQTSETIKLNIEALEALPFEIVACTHFLPLPGSDVWNNPEKYRIRILDKNLDHYNFYGYGSEGRRHILKIFEYMDRDTDQVNTESEEFLSYLENRLKKVNKG